MIVGRMIGSVRYNDIPKDPLKELFNNIKWKKMNKKIQVELDGIKLPESDSAIK